MNNNIIINTRHNNLATFILLKENYNDEVEYDWIIGSNKSNFCSNVGFSWSLFEVLSMHSLRSWHIWGQFIVYWTCKETARLKFQVFFYPKIINVYLIFYRLINPIIAFKWGISLFQGQFLQAILDKYKQDGHMNIMLLLLIPLSSTCIPASKSCSMLRSWILFYWGSDFTFVLIQYS